MRDWKAAKGRTIFQFPNRIPMNDNLQEPARLAAKPLTFLKVDFTHNFVIKSHEICLYSTKRWIISNSEIFLNSPECRFIPPMPMPLPPNPFPFAHANAFIRQRGQGNSFFTHQSHQFFIISQVIFFIPFADQDFKKNTSIPLPRISNGGQ